MYAVKPLPEFGMKWRLSSKKHFLTLHDYHVHQLGLYNMSQKSSLLAVDATDFVFNTHPFYMDTHMHSKICFKYGSDTDEFLCMKNTL